MTERMTVERVLEPVSTSGDGLYRFVEFSDDFGAWVVFYGPSGGENS